MLMTALVLGCAAALIALVLSDGWRMRGGRRRLLRYRQGRAGIGARRVLIAVCREHPVSAAMHAVQMLALIRAVV